MALVVLLSLCLAAPAAKKAAPVEGGTGSASLSALPQTEQDVQRAAKHFRSGTEAYVQGRYAEAIDEFERSYRYSGRSGPLFSLGQAHRRRYEEEGRDLRQLRLALARYQQYLDADPSGPRALEAERYVAELRPLGELELEGMGDAPAVFTRISISTKIDGATMTIDGGTSRRLPASVDTTPGAHRIEVRAPGFQPWIRNVEVAEGSTLALQAQLDELDARLFVAGPAGADLYVDGRRVGSLPLADGVAVPPGPHQIAVARPGKTLFVRELELERGSSRRLRAKLATTGQRKVAYAAFGIGAVGTSVGIAALVVCLVAEQRALRIERRLHEGSVDEADFRERQELIDQRTRGRNAALTFGLTGAALIGAGAILYVTDRPATDSRLQNAPRRRRTRAVDARVAPMFSPGFAGATVGGRF